jgi:hypothetical protein
LSAQSASAAPAVSWIASYPKSGNTWTRVMLASYLLDRQVASQEELERVSYDLQRLLVHGRLVPLEGPWPPVVKTHFLPRAEILRQYRDVTRKVVYLVRNPRDVIPSSARHLAIKPEMTPEFAQRFIEGRGVPIWKEVNWGTWPESIREWTTPELVARHFPNVEVRIWRYEDMREDTAGCLGQILDFLGLLDAADPDRVTRAVQNSSLERMRAAEAADRTRGMSALRELPRNSFVGEGRRDQSLAETLGQEVEDAYRRLLKEDEEFAALTRRFGYES